MSTNEGVGERAFENRVHNERFQLALEFLNLRLGNDWASNPVEVPADLLRALRDGKSLCQLIGVSWIPIPETDSGFAQEKACIKNLNEFRQACKVLNIPDSALFASSDLLEPTSLSTLCVVNCLHEVRVKLIEQEKALLNEHFSPGSASRKKYPKKQLSFHSPILPRSPLTAGKHNASGGLLDILPEEKCSSKVSPAVAELIAETPPSSRRVSINTINAQASIARVQERVASSYKERCKQLESGNAELLESVEDLQQTIATLQKSKQRYQKDVDKLSKANTRLVGNFSTLEAQVNSCFDSWQNFSLGSGNTDAFEEQFKLFQRTWKDISEDNESANTEIPTSPMDDICQGMSKLAVVHETQSTTSSAESERNIEMEGELSSVRNSLKEAEKENLVLKEKLESSAALRSKLQDIADQQLSGLKFELADLSNDFRSAFSSSATQFMTWSRELMARVGNQQAAHEDLMVRFKKEESRRKQLLNTVHNLKGNIRVMCRIRPVLDSDLEKPESDVAVESLCEERLVVSTHSTSATGAKKIKTNEFEFDRVFGPKSSQGDVFDEVQPMVESVMDGFQACIFAYGQTGSGKTFTMSGSGNVEGINYLALKALFELKFQRQATGNKEYTFTVRNVEIYCEKVIDLLTTSETVTDENEGDENQTSFVDIRYNERDGVVMQGVVEEKVENVDEVVAVMERGAKNRTSSHTRMNMESSRSHSVVLISVTGEDRDTGKVTSGKLVLVDLAGSERLAKSGVEGAQLKEAQSINKSLSCLGDVIAALESKAAHVPFRNSKLTMMLQDSLGKDNKALMILQVSPTMYNAQESICSLNFAARVRSCELGKAKKTERAGETAAMRQARKDQLEGIQKLNSEIAFLKKKLNQATESVVETNTSKENEIAAMKDRLKERYESIAKADQAEIRQLKEKLTSRESTDINAVAKLEAELHSAKLEINNLKQQLRNSISSANQSASRPHRIASSSRPNQSTPGTPRDIDGQALQERRASLDNIQSTPENTSKKQVSWKNTPQYISASPQSTQVAENTSPSRLNNRLTKPTKASVLGTAARVLQTPARTRTTAAAKAQRVPATRTRATSSSTTSSGSGGSKAKWVN